ncbi:cytidine deaminase [Winslowiella iniecta]|uniref:Cytidine deaminase n=1 Tax=Winslowiella iniecta TaxID=1560201 RepID=A0A0L7TAE0_9GAMM|nr:cytidine deaminase [Winslowiella iniecta]KOC88852.1 cytidine deaminase [Winslowiella iniecta]KOC92191.1 cytidine deaminase [Winslowiella iniecta]
MHPRFQSAFADLSPELQSALKPILDAEDFSARFSPEQIAAIKQQTALDEDALAFALLPLAAACALAPLSDFNVGAVARGKSGSWYFGANMEFAGATMQQTVHAEQSAVTHAWLSGELALEAITVNYSPCGHCRQFMNELNSGTALRIYLPGRQPATLGDYLPYAFGPRDLAIETLLLDPVDHGYHLSGDALEQQAINAASHSHAPYSNAHSGVALESASGQIYAGRYAENAAFNPSLPPLQAALILLNMHGESCTQITRAVLAESPDGKLIQRQATEATLQALGCQHIRCVELQKP